MNIVVIGSCLDSSNLAKELNSKMKNSVVFRIDMLKNLKNIIPFTSIVEKNNGNYLGDIEKISFESLSDSEKDIAKAFHASVKLIDENPAFSTAMAIRNVNTPTIDRVTRNFDSLSLTLLRVVSGLQTKKQLDHYLRTTSSSVVVFLEKPNIPLFPIEISKEEFLDIKDGKNGSYENHLFLTASDLDSLLKDEVFNLILNPTVKEVKKSDNKAEVEDEEKACEVERLVVQGRGLSATMENYRMEMINFARAGELIATAA